MDPLQNPTIADVYAKYGAGRRWVARHPATTVYLAFGAIIAAIVLTAKIALALC